MLSSVETRNLPDVFPEPGDRLDSAPPFPLGLQALALVGADASRRRAHAAPRFPAYVTTLTSLTCPVIPAHRQSAGVGEKQPRREHRRPRAVSTHEPVDASRVRTLSPAASDILGDFAYLKALDASPAADGALRSAVAALAAEAGKAASRDVQGDVQGAAQGAVSEAVQAVP